MFEIVLLVLSYTPGVLLATGKLKLATIANMPARVLSAALMSGQTPQRSVSTLRVYINPSMYYIFCLGSVPFARECST